MQKMHRENKNVEQRRDWELLRVIQVCIRRQSAATEMHKRGMVHRRDMEHRA
jgi:hypothetical protein